MNTPKIRFKGFADDWEQCKFKELCDMVTVGIANSATHAYSDSGVVMFRNQNIKPNFLDDTDIIHINSEFEVKYKNKRLKKNDLLVARTGYPGTACVVPEKYENSQTFTTLIARPNENVDPYFLCQYLNSDIGIKYFESTQIGGGQKNSGAGILNEMPVTLPSTIEEEKKIGDYFRILDHLITLHQRKCDETKQLKKFMLQKMFPKNGEKNPEIRFEGFTDDWEQRKLKNLIEEYKETVDSSCALPILTSSKTEGVILQEEHFGRKQNHDITGYNILPRNYCTYRNRSDGVDFTFNINKCCDKGIISKFYPVFCGKENDTFFISLVLNNSDEVVREIGYTCTGTGQKVLSFLDLQKMHLRVPTSNEQKKIAGFFTGLDDLITLHQRKCEKLKELKKFMLQNMFV